MSVEPSSAGQLPEGLDGLGRGSVWIGDGEDLRRQVALVVDLAQGGEHGCHFGMAKSNCLPVGVCKVHMPYLGSGCKEAGGEIALLDIHVEEISEENGVIETVLRKVSGSGSKLIELVRFITVQRLVDEGYPVAGSPFIGGTECAGEPFERLFPGDFSTPFSLH